MNSDPIVAEIRNLRERRAARFGFDVRSIAKDARDRDTTDDRQVIRRTPRRPVVSTQGSTRAITKR